MTTNRNLPDNRDEILYAFGQACPVPSAAQIVEWCEKYPQFAEDIRDHAAVSRDWAARGESQKVDVDQTELARGFSRVLNILYQADHPTSVPSGAEVVQSFQQAVDAHGTSVQRLAQQLDVGRSVLSALFNGRMKPPVGQRLKAAVMQTLEYTEAAFDAAVQKTLANPKIGLAKSEKVPTITPQTYEQVVESSDMPPARKRYWLGED